MPTGWKLVPEHMTLAMLAASKNAMRDYINRLPPGERRKAGRRHGIQEDVKHQIRWAAAIAAAPNNSSRTQEK